MIKRVWEKSVPCFFIYDEYELSQICFIFPTEGEGAEAVKPCPFERMAKHFTKSTDLRNFEDNVDILWIEIIKFGQVNVHMCFARACVRACVPCACVRAVCVRACLRS
jgi:hypothetical protein